MGLSSVYLQLETIFSVSSHIRFLCIALLSKSTSLHANEMSFVLLIRDK
jgi:hypothetical protein